MALNGRTALITGANRGLGRSMALTLAEAGVGVALVARDVEQLNAVAAEARRLGAQAEVFRTDISDESQVGQLERDALEGLDGRECLADVRILRFGVTPILAG